MSDLRDQNRFLVRMPDGMRDRIAEVAKANGRSMNSEIIARLEASFGPSNALKYGDLPGSALDKLLDRIDEMEGNFLSKLSKKDGE